MRTTIVVADDHRIVREGIRKLLETRDDFEVKIRRSTCGCSSVCIYIVWISSIVSGRIGVNIAIAS